MTTEKVIMDPKTGFSLKGSFILEGKRKRCRFHWVHRESKLMFTLSSNNSLSHSDSVTVSEPSLLNYIHSVSQLLQDCFVYFEETKFWQRLRDSFGPEYHFQSKCSLKFLCNLSFYIIMKLVLLKVLLHRFANYRPQGESNVFICVCLSTIGLMATRSLLILVMAWSARIIMECFLSRISQSRVSTPEIYATRCDQNCMKVKKIKFY